MTNLFKIAIGSIACIAAMGGYRNLEQYDTDENIPDNQDRNRAKKMGGNMTNSSSWKGVGSFKTLDSRDNDGYKQGQGGNRNNWDPRDTDGTRQGTGGNKNWDARDTDGTRQGQGGLKNWRKDRDNDGNRQDQGRNKNWDRDRDRDRDPKDADGNRQGQGGYKIIDNPTGNTQGGNDGNMQERPGISKLKKTGGSAMNNSKPNDPDKYFTTMEIRGLLIHNEMRHKHEVPELKLDRGLCTLSQEWAEECLKNGNMSHRPDNVNGENIFYAYSSDAKYTATPEEAVKYWYDEIKEFTFGNEDVSPKALHFTQVIWKATTSMGIGLASNATGETYITVNYYPRGNIVGHFVENIPKAIAIFQ